MLDYTEIYNVKKNKIFQTSLTITLKNDIISVQLSEKEVKYGEKY